MNKPTAPAFHRRHYENMAKIIRGLPQGQRIAVAKNFSYFLQADNPRFDEERFLRACTVVDFTEES